MLRKISADERGLAVSKKRLRLNQRFPNDFAPDDFAILRTVPDGEIIWGRIMKSGGCMTTIAVLNPSVPQSGIGITSWVSAALSPKHCLCVPCVFLRIEGLDSVQPVITSCENACVNIWELVQCLRCSFTVAAPLHSDRCEF